MENGLVKQQHYSTGCISYGMREYLLLAYPDEVTYQRVLLEKKRFFGHYNIEEPIRTDPQIMITGFQAREAMEETLLRWIQRTCSRHAGFTAILNNYSGFPTHSIFIRIQNQQPFLMLASQLKVIDDYINASACPPPRHIHKYYLTMADHLNEEVYDRAMPFYSRKTFHASFQVKELVLLARDHPFSSWKTITVFQLLPSTQKSYSEVA